MHGGIETGAANWREFSRVPLYARRVAGTPTPFTYSI
jgi:hypothetical protein